MKWYVAPPPALSGNDKEDLLALHNYVVSLHRQLDTLVNNNIDEENLTDNLKNKLRIIDENSKKIRSIIG